MKDLKGRWAFISGASRGIGYGVALFMADKGCNLILHGRKKEHLEKVREEAKKKGVEVLTVACELADQKAVEEMLEEIDSFGKDVDILFNNAGIQVTYRNEYLKTPAIDFYESFAVNATAPMMICYHFLPSMMKRGFGRIINTTSGIRLEPQQAAYSASKAALDKVTMGLASVYDGTDIIISLTDPGWCRTDLGGPNAPNAAESSLPGVVVGAFVDDRKSGRCFCAADFYGMNLEEAVRHAEDDIDTYKGNTGL